MSDSATPRAAAHRAPLCITNFQSLLKLMSIELVMPSNQLILSHPLLLMPSIYRNIRVFSKGSVLHIRRPKYWSLSFNISPFERLLLTHKKTLRYLASRREEFNLGTETRLDLSELLCNRVLLKYKRDRESFWHSHQKGAERVPPITMNWKNVRRLQRDPLPQSTFQDNRINQKALRKEKLSSSRIHLCYIILSTESKLSC